MRLIEERQWRTTSTLLYGNLFVRENRMQNSLRVHWYICLYITLIQKLKLIGLDPLMYINMRHNTHTYTDINQWEGGEVEVACALSFACCRVSCGQGQRNRALGIGHDPSTQGFFLPIGSSPLKFLALNSYPY